MADEETTTAVRYLYSLYWSLTTLTTVGYGDVIPHNELEIAYVSVGAARRAPLPAH